MEVRRENLDRMKFSWPRVPFSTVVRLNTDRVADPAAAGIERYVGIEHITPGDLRVRSWGLVAEGTTFTNHFRPGQVLFPKRRAYQRKVAVADFEGVCSGDIYVFESRDPAVLLPELLPFICQTDAFFDHAIGTSAGSLSPRTNWAHLAAYEFPLPPPDEQRRLVEVLSATEALLEELQSAAQSIEGLRTAAVEDFIGRTANRIRFREILLDASYGSSQRADENSDGVPILRIPNVLRNEIDMSDLKWVRMTVNEIERYSVREGDILIVRTNGNPEYVGRCVVAICPPEPLVFASYLIRLRIDRQAADPEYVAAALNAPTLRQELRGSVRSSAGNYNLNTQGIGNQTIPLLPLSAQQSLVKSLSAIRMSQQATERRIAGVIELKQELLSNLRSE